MIWNHFQFHNYNNHTSRKWNSFLCLSFCLFSFWVIERWNGATDIRSRMRIYGMCRVFFFDSREPLIWSPRSFALLTDCLVERGVFWILVGLECFNVTKFYTFLIDRIVNSEFQFHRVHLNTKNGRLWCILYAYRRKKKKKNHRFYIFSAHSFIFFLFGCVLCLFCSNDNLHIENVWINKT